MKYHTVQCNDKVLINCSKCDYECTNDKDLTNRINVNHMIGSIDWTLRALKLQKWMKESWMSGLPRQLNSIVWNWSIETGVGQGRPYGTFVSSGLWTSLPFIWFDPKICPYISLLNTDDTDYRIENFTLKNAWLWTFSDDDPGVLDLSEDDGGGEWGVRGGGEWQEVDDDRCREQAVGKALLGIWPKKGTHWNVTEKCKKQDNNQRYL